MVLLLRILIALVAAPVAGGLLTGADRIITARMQRRKGPPLLQPFYDVIKLLKKEATTVNGITRFFTTFSLVFTALSVVLLFIGQDLLLCVFSFTLACIFFVITGYSSYSPYSFIGAERELIQIMCYEPMVLITAFGMYEACGSFSTADMLNSPSPVILRIPLIFAGLLFVLTVKLRKSPFDLSMSHHGHQELVKGITTELTGICLAMVEMTHWFETIFALALVYLFFVYHSIAGHAIAVTVCLIVFFLEILIDNMFARLKWKSALKLCWIVTASLSFANFLMLDL